MAMLPAHENAAMSEIRRLTQELYAMAEEVTQGKAALKENGDFMKSKGRQIQEATETLEY